MPQLDRQRGNYGLKESNIAKVYADVLLLPPSEAERLKHWKNPTKQPLNSPTGDFVGILMQVLQNRCIGQSELSIAQLNQHLDDLSRAFDAKDKKKVIAVLLKSTSLNEQRWLVRIILKDLKIGIGHELVLKNYHSEALDLFNSTSDLKEVFNQLQQFSSQSLKS